MKISAPSIKVALSQDVHDALSYILKAYSIFTPNPELPLFQAVLVNPDRNLRHKSPQTTRLNLEAIVYEATNIPEMIPSPELQQVIERLASEISKRVEPALDKPMRSELENNNREAFVSVSSLVRAEVAGIVPEVNVPFGGRFLRERRHVAKLNLTSLKSRRYAGSYLSIFLWEQGEFLFKRMLIYLHAELGIRIGDRRLLAFVTKHITGTVSVLTNEFRNTDAGLSVPVPLGACFGSTYENETRCSDMGGVVGVHFIVFPVEKIEDLTWRFFPPIDMVDEENSGSDSSKHFETASRWARRESGVHLHGSDGGKDVSKDELEGSDSESSDSATVGSSSTSGEAIPVDHYQDISLSDPCRNWIDVNLGESLEDFAERQVVIAKHYQRLKDKGKSEHIVHLLQQASLAGNREAAADLAAFINRNEADTADQGVNLRASECALVDEGEAIGEDLKKMSSDGKYDTVLAADTISSTEQETPAGWASRSASRDNARRSVLKEWKEGGCNCAKTAYCQDHTKAGSPLTVSINDARNEHLLLASDEKLAWYELLEFVVFMVASAILIFLAPFVGISNINSDNAFLLGLLTCLLYEELQAPWRAPEILMVTAVPVMVFSVNIKNGVYCAFFLTFLAMITAETCIRLLRRASNSGPRIVLYEKRLWIAVVLGSLVSMYFTELSMFPETVTCSRLRRLIMSTVCLAYALIPMISMLSSKPSAASSGLRRSGLRRYRAAVRTSNEFRLILTCRLLYTVVIMFVCGASLYSLRTEMNQQHDRVDRTWIEAETQCMLQSIAKVPFPDP